MVCLKKIILILVNTAIVFVCSCSWSSAWAAETAVVASGTAISNAREEDFVEIKEFIPDVVIDLRYANENNITGQKIYDDNRAFLRKGTAIKLKKVCDELRKHGLKVKVWDAYRPPAAQFKLWQAFPDPRYIANPYRGFSSHSRGNTLDLTLIDSSGKELDMPSGFDDTTTKADRDYKDVDRIRAENAKLLESVMLKYGFNSIFTEWWHFVDSDINKYAVVKSLEIPVQVRFILDNSSMDLNYPVYMSNDRLIVSLRDICGALGADIEWDESNRLITVTKGRVNVKMKIGDKAAMINDKPVELDVAPRVICMRTFVPLRFISQALGANVNWLGTTKTVLINTKSINR